MHIRNRNDKIFKYLNQDIRGNCYKQSNNYLSLIHIYTLHGGIDFYNKRMWDVKEEDDTHVVFALVSPDGDQGFPGEVKIEV